MSEQPVDTEQLCRRCAADDDIARQELLARYRGKLRQMIAVRLDRRMMARLDPPDVVQEVLVEAHQKMDDWLRRRPLPLYPWLRQIAWQKLAKLHEHHHAHKRRVTLEECGINELPDQSWVQLADRLVHPSTSPSKHLLRKELRRRVRQGLAEL